MPPACPPLWRSLRPSACWLQTVSGLDPRARLRFGPLMTALQAAGGGLPLALHIPHVVEQAGSIAGFAAVVGLAVLSALYFSMARDLRRLREWAGRAPERAAEMPPGAVAQSPVPGRVVAVPQRPPQ